MELKKMIEECEKSLMSKVAPTMVGGIIIGYSILSATGMLGEIKSYKTPLLTSSIGIGFLVHGSKKGKKYRELKERFTDNYKVVEKENL